MTILRMVDDHHGVMGLIFDHHGVMGLIFDHPGYGGLPLGKMVNVFRMVVDHHWNGC